MTTPAVANHNYETIYVLKSGISDTDSQVIHQKVDNVIAKFSGKLKQRDDWGLKELAYPINDETNGRYCVAIYDGKAGVVEEIERHFKILDNVIRFLTVRVDSSYDYEKVKKQIQAAEEEARKNREYREQKKRGGY
ncbi:MAG: 30S ribosomal protein S6 [Deltaproteobacteria bacterium]|nr:30S ribosomal protein S6 [Deltaproteobacteria bacterium]MBI3293819.1 30S ribosomal protein S6 [Deltaproteobacteria bacterium]